MGTPDERAGSIAGYEPEPVNQGYENRRKHKKLGGKPHPQDQVSSVQANESNGRLR
jgi:NADH-quinone oxidoreductase subunit I